jgi:hypothetical protein
MLIPRLDKIFRYKYGSKYKQSDINRFISKIHTDVGLGPRGDCWEWTGSLNHGYGRFTYTKNNRRMLFCAHRVSYEIYNNKLIPKGLCVCHTCDNPKCVRPNHLFLGTHQDNMDDRRIKGRHATGEKSGMAKCNYEKINKIRILYNNGKYTYGQLSIIFGVSVSTIGRIVNNKLWNNDNYIRVRFKKLTSKVINKINRLYNTGNYSMRQLGKKFLVSHFTIHKIIYDNKSHIYK